MALGLSFGTKKNTTTGSSVVDKTEATTQNQTGTNTSSGTTTNNTSGQSSGTTAGSQDTSQTGTNKTTGSTTGQTQQTTSAFSDSTLGSIEKAVQDLFGTVGTKTPISNFDAESFVNNGVQAASNDINTSLESNINQLTTNLGGSGSSNSMAALLGNTLRGNAAADIAGVRSTLTGQAETINRDNQLAATQIAGQDQGFLGQLLASLKGGVTTTTGTETQNTTQDQQTQNTGTTNTLEQQQQQQSQQSVQTQQLVEMMQQLLSGSTKTQGSEQTTGTNSSSGGGFSLGL